MKCRKFSNISEKTRKQRNRMLAEELKKNPKKCRLSLRDEKGGRCCLQVAEDLAIKCGLDIKRSDKDEHLPNKLISDFYGWEKYDHDPRLRIYPKDHPKHTEIIETAANLNDGFSELKNIPKKGFSHKKIAEFFLNTYG